MMRLAATIALASALSCSAFSAAIAPSAFTSRFKCWHNVVYGEREDLPDEGDGFAGRVGNWKANSLPWRICRHCTAQKLDIYAPLGVSANPVDVVVYIHPGTWSHCFDKEAIPPALRNAILASGAVLVSPGYILQTDNTMNMSPGRRDEATFAAMLKDIDLAMSFVSENISRFGITPRRYLLMGESAGAHLALLYAYDGENPSPLSLGLEHKIRFERVVDIVGPVDFALLNGGVDTSALKEDNPIMRMKTLFNRLVGLQDAATDAELIPVLDRYSPVKLVCGSSPETVMAYGRLAALLPTDGLIPVSQMKSLEKALDRHGVKRVSRVFDGVHHGNVSTEGARWIVAETLKP